jgi:hypothetical protein
MGPKSRIIQHSCPVYIVCDWKAWVVTSSSRKSGLSLIVVVDAKSTRRKSKIQECRDDASNFELVVFDKESRLAWGFLLELGEFRNKETSNVELFAVGMCIGSSTSSTVHHGQ